ncbi:MAG TPA: HNH endonuclease [Granulicella sp.]|jgi:5-methylcytosine-specific restriction endonuclease McrA
MIRLATPQFSHHEIFAACVGYIKNQTTRAAVQASYPAVAANVAAYGVRATETLFRLQPEGFSKLQQNWLKKLYRYYLAGGKQRLVYDSILASSEFGICPYCGQRDTQTLDHYLPQSVFPEFAVLAENLVPCCSACNKEKGEHRPLAATQQVFHPYFDDWSESELLQATLHLGNNAVVTFAIVNKGNIDADIVARASTHFQTFHLGALYSTHAGVELVNSKEEFKEAASSPEPQSLRRELEKRMSKIKWPFHSWRRALYRELASNEAFLNGGYNLIDEPLNII